MAPTRPLLPAALPLLLLCARASLAWHGGVTSCHTVSVMRGDADPDRVLLFLWWSPEWPSPALVRSVWDEDEDERLLECSLTPTPEDVKGYLEYCKTLEATHSAHLLNASEPGVQRHLAILETRREDCSLFIPRKRAAAARATRALEAAEREARERVRRGVTMPGTSWCGAGDSAGNFSDLGVFQGPDKCCREHDRCSIHIAALQHKHGILNLRPYTISHCNCDTRFRACLMDLNDTVADIVGTTYFTVLQIPCFYLEESDDACVEWTWWGGCIKYGRTLVAHTVPPSSYRSVPSVPPPPQPETETGKDRKRSQKKRKQLGVPWQGGRPAVSQSCRCYQRLDECPYKIGPHEVKYQLRNKDSRTLFHCNCTRRLAQFLRRTKGPNKVEGEVLSNYVSASCFVLQPPSGCMEGEEEQPNCIDVGKAVLGPSRHLTNRLLRKGLSTTFKVKRQEWTLPGRPLQLFDRCRELEGAMHRATPR